MSFLCPIDPNKKFQVKNKAILLTVLCFLLAPALSVAGSFSVTPIRINFDSSKKTATIKIINQTDEGLTVQLSVKEWGQKETDFYFYDDTKDIVIFPRIVKLKKREERIIRVGYQGDKNLKIEKTYRLFFEELPVNGKDNKIIRFLLNMSMPIYVSPIKEVLRPLIENMEFISGTLAVKVKNNGNKHFIVGKITTGGIDQWGKTVFEKESYGKNVLAGAARTFDVDIPEEVCVKVDKVNITVEVEDNSTMKKDLVLDKAQCATKKEIIKDHNGQLKK